MTRQILQTVATSCIPSACKMTRYLFQTESYFLHYSWDDAVDRRKLRLQFYFFFYQQLKALLEQYLYFLLLLDIISPFELAYISEIILKFYK